MHKLMLQLPSPAAAPEGPTAEAQPQRMRLRRRRRASTQLYTMYLGVALNFWYPLITCQRKPCQAGVWRAASALARCKWGWCWFQVFWG